DSQRASARISGGRRDTNAPRKDGMAQNEQRRSQPDAIFSGATTPAVSRRRNTVPLGPVHGAAGSAAGGGLVAEEGRGGWRSGGVMGSKVRRSRGVWAGRRWPASTSSRRA